MANIVRRADPLPGKTPGAIVINNKEYFRLKTAAQVIGVEEKWLYRRIWKNKGPPYRKLGGTMYLLPVPDFFDWIENAP